MRLELVVRRGYPNEAGSTVLWQNEMIVTKVLRVVTRVDTLCVDTILHDQSAGRGSDT